jgi:DNA-directed RNA polymerase subunit RPC12/RpoP
MSEEVSDSLSCAECGTDLPSPRGNGLYQDGEVLACPDCRASNHVSCDETDEDGEWEAYISFYVCEHGLRDDSMCDRCEIDKGGGIGEAAT